MTMRFDWVTVVLQTTNFAVLVWLLQRFLYRPVLRMIDTRRAEIDNRYAEAEAAQNKAEEGLVAIERQQQDAAAARAVVVKEATTEAEKAAAARRAQAEIDIAAIRAEAEKTLAVEREKVLAEARSVALDLAAEIAGRVVAELPTEARAAGWIARIAQHLENLPTAEAGSLKRGLADDGALRVATALALPPQAAAAWQVQLRRVLGEATRISFTVDPQLIAGAELHFPSAILHFSFSGALAAMRAELVLHAEPR
jgi:F-type H+-transporting ATPase subunit b